MATGNDMKMHKGAYGSFIGMLKWTVPLIVVITTIVVLMIAS